MDWAAKFDLSFDIDQAASPRANLTADAGRSAEYVPADLDYAEAVDLTDPHTLRFDKGDLIENHFLHTVVDSRGPSYAFGKRPLNFSALYHSLARIPRPEIGLCKDVANLIDKDRELAGIVRESGGVLNDKRDASAVHRFQAVSLDDRGEEPREDRFVLCRAVDVIVKIGKHLEVLTEFRIECGQQKIQQPIAEQHDLQIKWDRIWLEGYCTRQADKPAHVLDDNLPSAKSPL
jgi:hypothetical protein